MSLLVVTVWYVFNQCQSVTVWYVFACCNCVLCLNSVSVCNGGICLADPEEFLTIIMQHIMALESLLKLYLHIFYII